MHSNQPTIEADTQPITVWLHAARDGDEEAMVQVFDAVYPLLHRMAAGKPGVSFNGTLSPTAVVHELFLKVSESAALDATDRQHFYAICSRAMRFIVMDFARMARSRKRGGDFKRCAFTDALAAQPDRAQELLDLHSALDELDQWDPTLRKLVELKFFGGLTHAEIGALNGRSERSIKRDWVKARAFLASRARTVTPSAAS